MDTVELAVGWLGDALASPTYSWTQRS